MAGVWQPCWGGHRERGLPNFCFIPSGGFVSSDVTATSREQPCEMLRGSALWARPPANPGASLCSQGTQTVPKPREKGDRLGRGGGTAALGEAEPGTCVGRWVGSCPGSVGRASAAAMLYPTSPQCRLQGLGSSQTPKGLRSWGETGTERGGCQGPGGCPVSFPGGCQVLRAGHQPSCVTRDEVGGTGRFRGALGRDVVLTQAPVGRLVPAVSRPWPAAKPSTLPCEKPSFSGSRKSTSFFPKGHLSSNAAEQSVRRGGRKATA